MAFFGRGRPNASARAGDTIGRQACRIMRVVGVDCYQTRICLSEKRSHHQQDLARRRGGAAESVGGEREASCREDIAFGLFGLQNFE